MEKSIGRAWVKGTRTPRFNDLLAAQGATIAANLIPGTHWGAQNTRLHLGIDQPITGDTNEQRMVLIRTK